MDNRTLWCAESHARVRAVVDREYEGNVGL
jgi:hypothetical protein